MQSSAAGIVSCRSHVSSGVGSNWQRVAPAKPTLQDIQALYISPTSVRFTTLMSEVCSTLWISSGLRLRRLLHSSESQAKEDMAVSLDPIPRPPDDVPVGCISSCRLLFHLAYDSCAPGNFVLCICLSLTVCTFLLQLRDRCCRKSRYQRPLKRLLKYDQLFSKIHSAPIDHRDDLGRYARRCTSVYPSAMSDSSYVKPVSFLQEMQPGPRHICVDVLLPNDRHLHVFKNVIISVTFMPCRRHQSSRAMDWPRISYFDA